MTIKSELAGDTIPFHPFANAFPLMNGDEFEKFVADIKRTKGPLEPIMLYQGKVLDGRNRYRSCLRLKIKPPFVEFKGDDAAAYAFVISKNIHRRHLSNKQKRDLIAKLLKANPERSNNATAKVVKVDDKTVGAVRAEMEATSEIPKLEKTIGADGKARKQPSRKRRTVEHFKRDIAAKKAAKSKPASAIEINGKPATAQEAVVEIIADDGELALLREFARFVLAHGEGLRFEPKERPKWAPLRDKVRAVLGIAS